jgi:hypothetical protein
MDLVDCMDILDCMDIVDSMDATDILPIVHYVHSVHRVHYVHPVPERLLLSGQTPFEHRKLLCRPSFVKPSGGWL